MGGQGVAGKGRGGDGGIGCCRVAHLIMFEIRRRRARRYQRWCRNVDNLGVVVDGWSSQPAQTWVLPFRQPRSARDKLERRCARRCTRERGRCTEESSGAPLATQEVGACLGLWNDSNVVRV